MLRAIFMAAALFAPLAAAQDGPIAIAVHGGAGTLSPDKLDAGRESAIRAALSAALQAGHARLKAGEPAIDAVVAAVQRLEASPHFNAGVGAVYTWEARHELDASVMDGRDRAAGAVAGVRTVKSPIAAAVAVMRHSPHVLLSGAGAEAFAQAQGLEMVPNSHFSTPDRLASLQRMKARGAGDKSGTVGAVALDRHGNLAAATSTGGMTGKRWGRVGDSPVIGAGTFADNRSCAVSATGHGEYFIRYSVASDICARVAYLGITAEEAANQVIHDVLAPIDGTGGVIVIDPKGRISMPFNTSGMYRGGVSVDGDERVAIFKR